MAKTIKRIDDLQPDRTNANKGTVRGRYMVEASLREVGAGRSIVADKHGQVIAGNKTLEAWTDIGGEIEVVRTDGKRLIVVQRDDLDLSDDTGAARKLAYYDNRAGEVGLEWDTEQLLADLNAGVDLSSMWHEDELDELLAGLQPEPVNDGGGQVDKAEELRVKWGVQTGQLWQLGEHRLICGDCTDADVVARVMGGEKADLLFTDPPYNVASDGSNYAAGGDSKWFGTAMKNLSQAEWDKNFDIAPAIDSLVSFVSNKGSAYVWCSQFTIQAVWDALTKWGDFVSYCVWSKTNPMPSLSKKHWTWNSELCAYATKAGHVFNFPSEGNALSVWTLPKNKETDHPTEKPVDLAAHAISHSSANGAIVLDGFLGSGTTIIACEQLGRKCRAVEISPGYVGVALERFYSATQKTPVLVDS